MTLIDRLHVLQGNIQGNYWGSRIVNELAFALRLSEADGNRYDDQIAPVMQLLLTDLEKNGAITIPAAQEAEEMLAVLSPVAKAIQIVCVAHAHIDMNWMWGYHETVAATIETFRTMLDLMEEYPAFTFSQSQASVYKIVEENDPGMLAEIKRRVQEGRWELTASTWVEPDKNLPNGESLARHILYTKRYLAELFDISPDSLQLDFEPDSFGHNWSVPEILQQSGVKYYYHCRGYDGENLYRWQARSGAEVLVYREPTWYNAHIAHDMFLHVPAFCAKYGVDCMLKVYGVGDHGGGPTRRDIEMLADMMTWPVMPSMKFGTYHEFFDMLAKHKDRLPVVRRELNCVFNGCYTSQSRIKMANRVSEDKLYQAEAICAAASALCGGSYARPFAKAWENVLFSQFHDILPGSCVRETREYAMGLFQRTLAAANTQTTNAMRAIAQKMDTSAIEVEMDSQDMAEGGGVGCYVEQSMGFRFPQTERGNGKVRIYHLFNPTAFDREAPVELGVWDWDYDLARIRVTDAAGKEVAHQVVRGQTDYWWHRYFTLLIRARVPAFGYATYVLTEAPATAFSDGPDVYEREDDRTFTDADIVLENETVKAVLDRRTMQIRTLVHKATGEAVVTSERPAGGFRLIWEDDVHGMTAWRVGPYKEITNLNETQGVRVREVQLSGLRQWVRYEMAFAHSKLEVTVSLDEGSSMLRYQVACDWHEVGRPGEGIPQLTFCVPLAAETDTYRYDIPFGTVDRKERAYDMPGNSYAVSLPQAGLPVMVVTDSKYGFRTVDNAISVSLIRSSFDPDPYPEYGMHTMQIGVAVPQNGCNRTLARLRSELVHAIPYVSGRRHAGSLPLDGQGLTLQGDVLVSCLKTAEESPDGNCMIVRLYDANGRGSDAVLTFARPVAGASEVDLTERMRTELPVDGNAVRAHVPPFGVTTIAVTFSETR